MRRLAVDTVGELDVTSRLIVWSLAGRSDGLDRADKRNSWRSWRSAPVRQHSRRVPVSTCCSIAPLAAAYSLARLGRPLNWMIKSRPRRGFAAKRVAQPEIVEYARIERCAREQNDRREHTKQYGAQQFPIGTDAFEREPRGGSQADQRSSPRSARPHPDVHAGATGAEWRFGVYGLARQFGFKRLASVTPNGPFSANSYVSLQLLSAALHLPLRSSPYSHANRSSLGDRMVLEAAHDGHTPISGAHKRLSRHH
ncbi:MAG: hypothetical protein KatS3mg060_1734 [Dehalococcoidia bacterium]|nr:MAG: hypothetical protein KatS3mg060_1734 [Dehalococcoidia bacterium]